MAIVITTLSGAITSSQTSFGVASATGITAPNYQTMTGITWLLIDQEFMSVETLAGTVVGVVRGKNGSVAQAHTSGSTVQAGAPGDFLDAQANYSGGTTAIGKDYSIAIGALNYPAINLTGSADAINPNIPGIYEVKTAGVDAMTLAAPPAAAEGNIIIIVSDTANAHTLTATSLLAGGTALKSLATFPAFRGASLTLRASNGVWQVLSSGNGNVSSFVVLS
jgi:hypothetical protein